MDKWFIKSMIEAYITVNSNNGFIAVVFNYFKNLKTKTEKST